MIKASLSRVLLTLVVLVSTVFSAASLAQVGVNTKEIKSGIWKGLEVKDVDREIAVKLKPGFSESDIRPFLGLHKAKVKQHFDELRWGWIELSEGEDIMPVISALASAPAVEVVEPNLVGHEAVEPNDPYFKGTAPATYPHQWALKNTGQSPPGGTSGADIDGPEAWDVTTGSPSVIIAILDSGIPLRNGALSHPDLDDPN